MQKRFVKDYLGKKIHHLTILKDNGIKKECRRVLVQCDCDNKTIKEINFSSLFQKVPTKSCGCVKAKNIINSNLSHGMSYTREHKCWAHMKARCYDKNDIRYYCYGAKGLKVCPEWLHSFEQFMIDMGPLPSPKHSVERIDNDKDYTPSNCKWATYTEQANNKTNNRKLTCQGRSQTLSQWSKETGIHRNTIARRIDVSGWSVDTALSTLPPALRREKDR
jgi:hypothetical protein